MNRDNGLSATFTVLDKDEKARSLQQASDIVNNIKLNKYPEEWGVGITLGSLEEDDLDLLMIDRVLLKEVYDAFLVTDDESINSPQIMFRYDQRGFVATLELYELLNFREPDLCISFPLTENQLITIINNLIKKHVRIYDVENYDIV